MTTKEFETLESKVREIWPELKKKWKWARLGPGVPNQIRKFILNESGLTEEQFDFIHGDVPRAWFDEDLEWYINQYHSMLVQKD